MYELNIPKNFSHKLKNYFLENNFQNININKVISNLESKIIYSNNLDNYKHIIKYVYNYLLKLIKK